MAESPREKKASEHGGKPSLSPAASPKSGSPLPSPTASGHLTPSSKPKDKDKDKEKDDTRTTTRNATSSNASETRPLSSSSAASSPTATATATDNDKASNGAPEKKEGDESKEKKDDGKPAPRSGKLNISAFEQNLTASASSLSSGPKPVMGGLKDRIANLQVAALASPTSSTSPDTTPSTKSAPGRLKLSGLSIPVAQTPETKEKADREKKAVGKLNATPLMSDLNSMLSSGPKPIKRDIDTNGANGEEKREELSSPSNSKEKDKAKDSEKDKEREPEKEKDREKDKEKEKEREKEREKRQKQIEENLKLPTTIGETSTATDEPNLQHVQMSRPKVTRKHRSAAGRGGKKPPATKPKFKEVEFEEIAAVKVKIVEESPDGADSKKRSKRNRDDDGKEKSEDEKEKEKAEEEERERERARASRNEEEIIEEERKRQEEILRQVAEDEKRREEELLKKLNEEEKKIRDDALAYFEGQYKTLGFDERKATSYMILLAQGALVNKYDLRKGKKEQKKMFATSNGQLFFTEPKKGKPDPRDSIQLHRVREVQKGRVGAPFQKAAKKAADGNCLVIVGSEADAFLEMNDEEGRNLWVEALLYVKHVGPEAGQS